MQPNHHPARSDFSLSNRKFARAGGRALTDAGAGLLERDCWSGEVERAEIFQQKSNGIFAPSQTNVAPGFSRHDAVVKRANLFRKLPCIDVRLRRRRIKIAHTFPSAVPQHIAMLARHISADAMHISAPAPHIASVAKRIALIAVHPASAQMHLSPIKMRRLTVEMHILTAKTCPAATEMRTFNKP